ncbi:MAG: alpha/beta hydrolase [Elusimicrobia bacterium]|nr:alpha/beta hydrolase [Elusimicrobiota bacterium]
MFLFLILFFVVGGVTYLAWRSSNLVLTGARGPLTSTPRTFGLTYTEENFLTTDGVSLRGWFLPSSSPSDTSVVICHGWGGNRSHMIERTHFLRSRGDYSLFYFDFRNHGESGAGRASLSRDEISDLEAALRHLRAVHPAESARIGLYGQSLGGSIGLWVAAHDPRVDAIAAESPFSEFNGAVTRHGKFFYHAPRFFSRLTLWFVRRRLGFDPNDYAPLKMVHRIAPRPLFLLQGERDVRTPPIEGQRLFDRAGEPKTLWTVPGAGHGELAEVGGRHYQDKVLGFFNNAFHRTLR